MPSSPKGFPSELSPVLFAALAILGTAYALVLLAWAGVGTSADPRLPGLLRYHHVGQIWGLVAGAVVAFAATIMAFWLLGRAWRRGTPAAWAALVLFAALALNIEPRLLGPPMLADGGWLIVPLLAPSYRVHLPLLNAWLAGALALTAARLVWRGRSRAVAWGATVLGLTGAALLVWIARGGRFSQIDGLVKPVLWIAAGVAMALSLWRAAALLRGDSGESEPAA